MTKSTENVTLEIQDPTEDVNSRRFETESRIQFDSHLFNIMVLQQKVLNKRIGTQAWKKYLSAAFWNYITTPINFSITLLTAVATGQAATSNILSQQQTLIILFVTFVLTTTNSFFKLNTKMNLNFEAARSYYAFGGEFEKIYYTPLFNDLDVKQKLSCYERLHERMNAYVVSETIENQNYVTEMIYFVVSWADCCSFLGNISEWIVENERHDDLEGGAKKDTVKNKLENIMMSAFGKNSVEINDLNTKFMSLKNKVNFDIEAQQKNIDEKNKYEKRFENILKEQQKTIDDLRDKIYLSEKQKWLFFSQTSDSKEVEKTVVVVNKDEKEKDTSSLDNGSETSNDGKEMEGDDENGFIRGEITRHFCDISKYMKNAENDKLFHNLKIMKAINEVVQKIKEETIKICGEKYDYGKVIFEPRYSFRLIQIFHEAYSKILKVTELITDEYINYKVTEIFFLVDRENTKKLTRTMIPVFYNAIIVFLNDVYNIEK